MKHDWYIYRASFRILFPAFSGIILYLVMLMVFGNLGSILETFFSQEALYIIVLAYINHEGAIFLMGRRQSREALEPGPAIHKILYFIIMAVLTVFLTSTATLIYFILVIDYYHFITELVTLNILMLTLQGVVHLNYLSMLNIHNYHRLSIEMEEMKSAQLELEMESFRTEMNPDLLMECLENLLTLMQKDTADADKYIRSLSDQYRYLLDSRKTEFVGLKAELQAAAELVSLLNGGGQEKMRIDSHTAGSDLPVIPGTIHSIIFNAENSMILNPLDPLMIKLSLDEAGDILLRHEDRAKLVPGKALKMDKLNKSYIYFTGRGIEHSINGNEITWRIPHLPEIIQ